MKDSINLTFTKAPSLLTAILGAINSKGGTFDPQKPLVGITATRNGITPDPKRLRKFAKTCRIEIEKKLPMIYPMTFIYPLVQVMLARREVPLLLTNTLNTRTVIVQHRHINLSESLDVFCKLTGHRLVEKGVELDVDCTVQIDKIIVWECTITFYYRGKYGNPDTAFQPPQLEAIPDAPEIARWFLPSGGGLAFSRLSGDFNPLHYWKGYAKFFGFQRDFAQPLLVLAETLSRLEKKRSAEKLCLDIIFKGPVYYESNVILKSITNGQAERFDIYCKGNPRPCICGNLNLKQCSNFRYLS